MQRAMSELIEKRVGKNLNIIEARPGKNGLFKFDNGVICNISTKDIKDQTGIGIEIKPLYDGCLDLEGQQMKTELKTDRIYETPVCETPWNSHIKN